MAQHGAMFCFSDLTTTRTTEQVPSPQSLTAVQLRRDFPVTPESWNLAWLFPSCQLTRGSTWLQKRKRRRTLLLPRRLPSNRDPQAPLLAIPMRYVIVRDGPL
jgi:hypothetical protein